MAKAIQKIAAWMERILIILCAALFLIMTFAAFMQVFTRFILGSPWKWTDEVCRYSLVWLTMLGAALGVKRHSHLAIDAVIHLTPAPFQNIAARGGSLLTALFGCVLTYQGIVLCMTFMQQRTSVLGLPMGMVNSAIPVFSVFLVIFSLASLTETAEGREEET